jgi:hypothetical protein
MLADSIKQVTHALITGGLLSRRLGGFRGTRLWPTLMKIGLASLMMSVVTVGALLAVQALRLPEALLSRALSVAVPSALGLIAYFVLAVRLDISEARLALNLIRKRLRV